MNERKSLKHERVGLIIDILERWGRLDHKSICERLANRTDEDKDSESFKRAVYRDLDSLVDQNRIAIDRFTRDMVLIEDYDSEIHKNVIAQWYIPEAEGLVSGSKILDTLNGKIYIPKILKNDFSIKSGATEPDPRHCHFYFMVGSTILCLKAAFSALPFNLVISRIHGDITQEEIQEVQKKIGLRTAILKVPFSKLSSYKPSERIGNTIIKINAEKEVLVSDDNSTNGTVAIQLTLHEADQLRSQGARMLDETLTSTWTTMNDSLASAERIKKETSFKTPLTVVSGNIFKILVI